MKNTLPGRISIFFVVVLLSCQISLAQSVNREDETMELIAAGVKYFDLGHQGATQIALEKFSTALEKCREMQIKECEIIALTYLGQISLRAGNSHKALDLFQQSLALFAQIEKDEQTENFKIEILLGMGFSNLELKNNESARKYFEDALAWSLARNDKPKQAIASAQLGNAYRNLGQRDKALEKYQEALKLFQTEKLGLPPMLEVMTLWEVSGFRKEYGNLEYHRKILAIHRKFGDIEGTAMTLNVMFMISAQTGNIAEAEEFCDQAVAVARSANDINLTAEILNFTAYNYIYIGEFAKAIEIAEQILPIYQNRNYITGTANVLGFIGATYLRLGDYARSIEKYQRSLNFYQSKGCYESEQRNAPTSYFCRKGEIVVVTGMAKALNSAGKKASALNILEVEAKKIEFESDSIAKSQETGMLFHVVGQMYSELNENDKAIRYYSLAAPLIDNANSRQKSRLLVDRAQAQPFAAGQLPAPVLYDQSLLLLTPFAENTARGREEAVGFTLASLMSFHKSTNPKLAVFFGKKAVESYNQVRQAIKNLDRETQKTFLKSIENNYRILAESLIEQGRVEEALQVLNSFKDQQFFDFETAQQKTIKPPASTLRERETAAQLQKANSIYAEIEQQAENLKKLIGRRAPDAEETNQLNTLKAQSKIAADDFLAVFRQAELEFSKPADEKDKINVLDSREIQNTLRDLSQRTGHKTVAVYQLIGEANFHSLVVTPDTIKSFSTPINKADLQKRALEFWAVLQSPKYDPAKLGQELYQSIFKFIEKELPEEGKSTVLWSLDGNLRYVPMAALHDGSRYLVERFNHVNFTRADRERLTRSVSPTWTGTGFGTSKAQSLTLADEKIDFSALPGVNEELAQIFKSQDAQTGILTGAVWLDEVPDAQFNRKNMLTALKLKRPLVHIASHFSFQPGDESRSFLLMGDGTAFTLADMKKEANLFAGVELLTLSACSTAAQQADSNGKEIDGFAELAQRLGAGAVMATLWQVSDASTPWLMRDFYAARESNAGMTKTDALRTAQLALLNGTSKTRFLPEAKKGSQGLSAKVQIVVTPDGKRDGGETRAEIVYVSANNAPLFKKDEKKPFAHPFYWSPFVLIGNWR